MPQKIVIVRSMNLSPEDEVNERIEPLIAEGFRVVSASTALAPFGEWTRPDYGKCAQHVYYVTTVLLEKP